MASLRTESPPGKSELNGDHPNKPADRTLASCRTPRNTFVALLARGFWPVVIYPRGAEYKTMVGGKLQDKVSEGKNPIGSGWGADRWTVDKAAKEFNRWSGAGVGVCLGPGRAPGGAWLGDVEGDGPEAEESRAKLFDSEPGGTMGHSSARGGHQFFRFDGNRLAAIVAKLKPFQVKDAANQPGVFHIPALPGLELRLGGFKKDGKVKQLQSVVPPTEGTDGKPRQWNGVETIADAPESFYTALEAIVSEAAVKPQADPVDAPKGKPFVVTMTASNSADEYLKTALSNAVSRIESKGPGERRDTYRDEAYCLAGYLYYNEQFGVGYTEAELSQTLKAARAVGVGHGDPVVEETVDDAIAAGKLAPRQLKDDVHQVATRPKAKAASSGQQTPPPTDPSTDQAEPEQPREPSLNHRLAKRPRTDLGNAERLVARHGGDLRFCHPWKKWLVWDGRRWKVDDTGGVRRKARATVRAIFKEAATLEDDEKRKALGLWQMASETRDKLAALVSLAEAEEGIPILPPDLDLDPWLLNCPNGTLDLRTGHLREHRREDRITRLCPVKYDGDAQCPLWTATLDKILAGNLDLIAFVQRLCGCILTGTVTEQVLPILHGTGANGKSTILNTLLEMLGTDYAMKAPPELLMVKRTESHPTERASLFGKRLVVAIETGEGARVNETLIKELTGSDKISARRMREDFWEFKPTHKILLCTNHKPAVRGTDYAIWRRLKLIPFDVKISDAEADKDMPEKLLGELPGILAWCMQGCLDWQEDGLKPPAEVSDATEQYRQEEDVLGGFLDEHCITAIPSLRTKSSAIYDRYRKWAERSGENAVNQTKFGKAMTERGFKRSTSNGTWYEGIGLRSDEEDSSSKYA